MPKNLSDKSGEGIKKNSIFADLTIAPATCTKRNPTKGQTENFIQN